MNSSCLLGVDLGTTHCKAATFDRDGTILHLATQSTPVSQTDDGLPFHDPEDVWAVAASVIRKVVTASHDRTPVVVGVTSMAEAGLLVDAESGKPRTHIIPWYDSRAAQQVDEITSLEDPRTLFRRTGLHPSFKFALPKLLWLRERDPGLLQNARWLSVADYLVYRLTGTMATDPSLAARTYAYSLQAGDWDGPWLRRLGLEPGLFPPILRSGEPAGTVTTMAASQTRLPVEVPAAVCGHDHICTMMAAGVVEPGRVLDSIGTAESMLGVVPCLDLTDGAFDSGLAFVPHVLPGRYCWLGGLSAAGGSIEWLRQQFGVETLSYDDIVRLAHEAGPEPTGILYFPYLSGSGAPLPDGSVRAAFIGLDARHNRANLVRAVLEGTAFASEGIRRAAEEQTGAAIEAIVAVGGGARNDVWMQIRADVSGCRYIVPALPEATALGAALTAGLGALLYENLDQLLQVVARQLQGGATFAPDRRRHAVYSRLYINGFLDFQDPLRRIGRAMEFPDRDL
jgi:sugar (pentulose or hexulose) kinase